VGFTRNLHCPVCFDCRFSGVRFLITGKLKHTVEWFSALKYLNRSVLFMVLAGLLGSLQGRECKDRAGSGFTERFTLLRSGADRSLPVEACGGKTRQLDRRAGCAEGFPVKSK
jgi:hypothetical protein